MSETDKPERQHNVTRMLYGEAPLSRQIIKVELSPPQVTLLGFLVVIFLGTLLLWLPISVREPHSHSLLISLFTATSAVCVTGLNVVDPGTHFTLFGQITIMLLIQIGGVGYMTLFSLMALAVGKRLSLRNRWALREVLDFPGQGGTIHFVLRVVRFTLVIEALGMIFLALTWIPRFGWIKGLYFSLFHSISAFNNAGFSLFSDSLMSYRTNIIVILSIAVLIILGGLGYPVISEMWQQFSQRRFSWNSLSLNARVGLLMTASLLMIGTILIFGIESQNPDTMAHLPWWDRGLSAFFESVTARTAGFNSIDTASLSQASLFFLVLLMFIGTNPGGTGGGVKTTTLAIALAQTLSVITGKESVIIQKRRLNTATINRVTATLVLSFLWINLSAMLLTITEGQPFRLLMFETISAFGTVGLSANVTPTLSIAGQILIILTMYAGRVGILTVAVASWLKPKRLMVQYAEESLLVG